MEIIYTTETYNYTPQMVADEFAARYFEEPRNPRRATKVKEGKFRLRDGTQNYEIMVIPAVPYQSPELYAVVRL